MKNFQYYAKYTVGSYVDALVSIPILVGEKLASGLERILGDKTPECLTVKYTQEKNQVFVGRERLRQRLDTRPGMLYLQSNIIAAIPLGLKAGLIETKKKTENSLNS